MKTRFGRGNLGYLYIAPWIIGFLSFQLYPLIASLVYSFTNYNLGEHVRFVGIANYRSIFTVDPDFYNSLKVTFIYVLFSVPLKVGFALLIALILNMRLRGMNIFRTIYYLPSILGGSVAVSILWRYLFAGDGLVNRVLSLAALPPMNWLTDARVALFTIGLLAVWQFGSSMVLFLAGLKQVPSELYEAGRVDGAHKLTMFVRITLPMISPIVFFNLVMQMINAFQDFTSAFIITGGGPLKATWLYGLMLYWNGFAFFKMGYAAALSWVLFVIILSFTLLLFRSSRYWTFYSEP
jgi:oligogalacturonide transport system permease protein